MSIVEEFVVFWVDFYRNWWHWRDWREERGESWDELIWTMNIVEIDWRVCIGVLVKWVSWLGFDFAKWSEGRSFEMRIVEMDFRLNWVVIIPSGYYLFGSGKFILECVILNSTCSDHYYWNCVVWICDVDQCIINWIVRGAKVLF